MNQMTKIPDSSAEARIKELEEENGLLFEQIQVVQEELERRHLQGTGRTEQHAVTGANLKWVDDELPAVMAENARYRAMLETQKEVHRLEAEHALASKLGEILIEGATSSGALLAVPSRLLKIWRKEKRQAPPGELGGKGFEKVIAAYREGGLGAVGGLLKSVSASATIRANALTAVARSVMHQEPAKAAELAREAYVTEPRPFRLKWLAFRLHEAGDVIEAEAMLHTLPPDTKFSDSEARQASRLRNEAKEARLHEAKHECGFSEARREIERQVAALTQARDEQAELAMQRQIELDAMRLAQAQKEQEISALTEQREALHAEMTALSLIRDEYTALAGRQEEAAKLAAERGREVEALKAAKVQLEQEKSALAGRQEEQAKVAAERMKQITELQEQIKSHKAVESELSTRQQGMQEELVRAEAQLDLIKDMLLREPRL